MPKTTPRLMAWAWPQRVRWEIFRLSSWATLAMMVRRNSPSSWRVSMPSLRKITPTPRAFSSRVRARVSTVLRANRETSLVTIRSISPARASWTIRRSWGRRAAEVPDRPSSAKIPAGTQSRWPWRYWAK